MNPSGCSSPLLLFFSAFVRCLPLCLFPSFVSSFLPLPHSLTSFPLSLLFLSSPSLPFFPSLPSFSFRPSISLFFPITIANVWLPSGLPSFFPLVWDKTCRSYGESNSCWANGVPYAAFFTAVKARIGHPPFFHKIWLRKSGGGYTIRTRKYCSFAVFPLWLLKKRRGDHNLRGYPIRVFKYFLKSFVARSF